MYDTVNRNSVKRLPQLIRVSLGSAMVLQLMRGRFDVMPTTAYLLTYRKDKCDANCGFCPQARRSHGRQDMLSRVSWPIFQTRLVLYGIEKAVKDGRIGRVCIQALNYPEVFKHLLGLVNEICSLLKVPVSISCQPLNHENMKKLANAGAQRIGIPLDAATEEIFDKVKGHLVDGPYVWKEQYRLLREAVDVFGKRNVSTHLIVGLGEKEKEMVDTIQKCVDIEVLPALFAFTPVSGTALANNSQPPISTYRRIQLARHLIFHRIARYDDMQFDKKGCINDFGLDKDVLIGIIQTGEPFLTSGCSDCNRPYYNEKPGGPIYNYPRSLTEMETTKTMRELMIHYDTS